MQLYMYKRSGKVGSDGKIKVGWDGKMKVGPNGKIRIWLDWQRSTLVTLVGIRMVFRNRLILKSLHCLWLDRA